MKFNIGDIVKVAKKVEFSDWMSDMDIYIGEKGQVISFYNYSELDGVTVLFPNGDDWVFPEESLEPVGEK